MPMKEPEQPDRLGSQEKDAERKRRLANVFGEVLPDATRDERSDSWGDREGGRGGAGDDEWLENQVPPHHG